MSRCVLVLVVLLAGCKDKTPSPSGLAERVRDKITATLPDVTVKIQDPRTLLVRRGDYDVTMNLDNLATTCRGGEVVCNDAIAGAIANIKLADDKAQVVKPEQLVITIKPGQWFLDTDKMLKEKAPEQYEVNKLVAQLLPGDLVAVLGADHSNGITMVSAEQLREMKLEANAAFAQARKNLKATHETLDLELLAGTPVWTNRSDDNYISAMIMLPELWKPLAAKVKGDLLVAFPARNRVFATGTKDPGAEEGIAKIANVAFQTEDHPIAPTIFKWSATSWTVHEIR
ncbi:MAG: hypothetical protein M4D80_30190 [Myxococcota bacterium]|nr:hypothetical protein [Deltaproteobacteria bacterium]MDQ3339457.1 hypothetical protein [Myxococcota bacterium]